MFLDTPEQHLRDTLGLLIPYTKLEIKLLKEIKEIEETNNENK